MSQVLRSVFSLFVPIALLIAHFVIMLCFINRWDSVVTITLVPIWMWAAVGILVSLLGAIFFKSRLSMLVILIWIVTAAVCSDESPTLLRGAKQLLFPPSFDGAVSTDISPVPAPAAPGDMAQQLSVASLNCNQKGNADAAAEELIARLKGASDDKDSAGKPVDVVFLQEAPGDAMLATIQRELFGADGSRISGQGCAIIARGKLEPIELALDLPGSVPGAQLAAMLQIAPGVEVELVNVHLKRSIMYLNVWRKEAWQGNTALRIANRSHLRSILRALPERAMPRPRVVGGDFGTPYHDDLFRVLKREHTDAFRAVGTGWGNTYPVKFPVLRIDQIWTNAQLTAQSAELNRSANSDHCMIRATFSIRAKGGFLAFR